MTNDKWLKVLDFAKNLVFTCFLVVLMANGEGLRF